jgi:hypothetical protein
VFEFWYWEMLRSEQDSAERVRAWRADKRAKRIAKTKAYGAAHGWFADRVEKRPRNHHRLDARVDRLQALKRR